MYGCGAHPVQGSEVPCQGTGNDANVDQARCRGVAEIRERQVEEVDDNQEFGDPVPSTHVQVYEAEEEEVVRDEMASDVDGSSSVDFILGCEAVHTRKLQGEEDEPVDGCYDGGLCEWCRGVVLPEAAMVGVRISRRFEGVVGCCDGEEEVGERCCDAQTVEGAGGVGWLIHCGGEKWCLVSKLIMLLMSEFVDVRGRCHRAAKTSDTEEECGSECPRQQTRHLKRSRSSKQTSQPTLCTSLPASHRAQPTGTSFAQARSRAGSGVQARRILAPHRALSQDGFLHETLVPDVGRPVFGYSAASCDTVKRRLLLHRK